MTIKIVGQELSSELNIHGATKAIFSDLTLNYKTKKRLEISVGFIFGLLNYDLDNSDTDFPYKKLDQEAFYINGKDFKSYSVSSFTSRKIGKGLNIGFGTYWNLNNKSFMLLSSNFSYYIIDDHVEAMYTSHGLYYPIESIEPNSFVYKKTIHYRTLSGGISIGYMHKLTNKTRIKLLVHLPFYYPLPTAEYNPLGSNFGLVALEPNLSIGVNYIIKKR